MSNDGVNTSRRTFLIGATSAVAALGAVGAAVPFVKSWMPSAKAENAGAPIKFDISKLQPGQRVVGTWRGQPAWVVNRTQDMLDTLPKMDSFLRDPHSKQNQQPPYATNEHRSIKPKYFVVIGICTHLGCVPEYRPKVKDELRDPGFFCPCHGSKYDIAGRVYKGVPAPLNLVVPPHSYLSDNVIIVGSEKGETKA